MENRKAILKIIIGIVLFVLLIIPTFENIWIRIIQVLLYCIIGSIVEKNIVFLYRKKKDKAKEETQIKK